MAYDECVGESAALGAKQTATWGPARDGLPSEALVTALPVMVPQNGLLPTLPGRLWNQISSEGDWQEQNYRGLFY